MYSRTVCSQSVDHNQKVGHCKVFDGCGVRSEITTSGSEKKDGTINNSTTNLMLKVWLREVKISSFFFTHTHTQLSVTYECIELRNNLPLMGPRQQTVDERYNLQTTYYRGQTQNQDRGKLVSFSEVCQMTKRCSLCQMKCNH